VIVDLQPGYRQLSLSRSAFVCITAGQNNTDALTGKLPAYFETNPPVSAGHHSDLLVYRFHSLYLLADVCY
jgi:hypothetical protein